MLCDICHDTIRRVIHHWHRVLKAPKDVSIPASFPHHRSLKSLWESLLTDCHICNSFVAQISPSARALILESLGTKRAFQWDGTRPQAGDALALVTGVRFLPRRTEHGHAFIVRLEDDFIVEGEQGLENIGMPATDDDSKDIEVIFILDGELPSPSPPLPLTEPDPIHLAKRWIAECQDHKTCKASYPEPGSWFPTRLLDLDGSQGDPVRLIETKNNTPTRRYMTLSHCWGAVQHLKLTRATYDRLCHGILPVNLRRIFQDAIHVARGLGVRYLWIDALCILQDSDDLSDWKREAPLMQDVYSHSLCNISALDAPDGNYTMLPSRNPDSIFPPVVHISPPPADNDTDPASSSFSIHSHNFWHHHIDRATLHTRAWVVQERLLAPRVLHIGNRHILWECASHLAADIYPAGLPAFIPAATPKAAVLPSSYDAWREVVHAYTQCHLTNPGDKLIACAGLAKRIALGSGDDYTAGLWQNRLEYQLLWEVATDTYEENRRPGGDASRPAAYRAPSWSWASLDGPVKLPALVGNGRPALATAEVVWLDHVKPEEKFGAVTFARLRLRGVLLAAQIWHPTRVGGEGSVLSSTWHIRMWGATMRDGAEGGWTRGRIRMDVVKGHYLEENEREVLVVMPVALENSRGALGAVKNIARGLVLKVEDQKLGSYSRVGVAEWETAESDPGRYVDKLRRESSEIGPFIRTFIYYFDGLYSINLV